MLLMNIYGDFYIPSGTLEKCKSRSKILLGQYQHEKNMYNDEWRKLE